MRAFFACLLFAVCVSSGVATAQPVPMSGEEILRFFFAHTNQSLDGERCQITGEKKPFAKTVGDYFAKMVGEDARRNKVKDPEERRLSLYTECSTAMSEFQTTSGEIVTGWGCSVYFITSMKDWSFIGRSGIRFAMSPDKTKIIKGTINCDL